MHPIFKQKWFQGLAGILLALGVAWLIPGDAQPKAPAAAAIVTLMAWLWVFEIIPIAVTSLIPLVALPAMELADAKTASAYYGKPIIFLFLGGFLLAIGLQKSGLHKRLALRIAYLLGGQPARIVLGFMLAAGFLSMWISNTASVMVMMPIGLSIIEAAKSRGAPDALIKKFGVAIMLGIAYAADIGGMATLIGTPPNMVFVELYHTTFPDAPPIGFGKWLVMGLPITISFMFLGWLLLTKVIFRMPKSDLFGGREILRGYLLELGPVRRDEFWAGMVFFLAVILWITGSKIELGDVTLLTGWRKLLGLEEVSDSAVAIFAAFLLFIIPSRDRKGEALIIWKDAKEVPWGILLLFGGGFAIAGAFELSGLSVLVQNGFSNLDIQSPFWMIVFVCLILTFLTEITSNTAMTTLVLPILASAAVVLEMDPRLILIPATLSASCAFMMPIASPTQAIVFGSGHVPIKQMIRAGLWFNLLGIILVTLGFMWMGQWVLGIDPMVLPDWAQIK